MNHNRRCPIYLVLPVFLFLFLTLTGISNASLPDKNQQVNVIEVKAPIIPVTAKFIERGIQEAERNNAICVILLDTPGGLISSMRVIIQSISESKIPVVVYIYPKGAMATSAGTYITYASHVAAMSPGTHIGSAHPVSIGFETKRRRKPGENDFFESITPTPVSSPGKNKEDEEITDEEVNVGDEKAVNAMVALIRSLAEKTGRNADWGEKAVRESVSVTAIQALELNVIEIVAEDLPDLLGQLKGREIKLSGRETVVLDPSQDDVNYIQMTRIEKFLEVISEPQIALILLLLGGLGIYYEISSPGFGLPGIVGVISLILALYSLGSLPINYAALALLILSVGLFIAEAFTPTFGAFTAGGIVSFILGALFLVPAGMPFLQISRTFIVTAAVIMGVISFLIVWFVGKSMKSKAVSGVESLKDETAVAKTDITNEGMILLRGELWKARSSGDLIKKGSRVVVEDVKGLLVTVREKKDSEHESG
jgi:membrane-bound serine protease (ClpP class)